MTQSSKKWIIFLLKTILMGAIVYYIVSGIDFEQFSKSIYEYGIIPLGIGAALLVFNDFVQGMRWRYLTRNQCSLMASFESIVVGGFLNMILPAKLGEVSRLIYLRNIYNYPFNYGVGVMVIERGADLFMVACFMALGAGMATGNLTMEWISIFLIFGMIGIVFWIKNDRGALFMKLLKRLPFRLLRTYSKKIIRLIIKDIGSDRLGKVILYTLVLRGFYFITVAYFLNGVA
ncbi:lysylphosphatidylglycerol synthase transmembrane domain-containing protein, partial [Sulfuricurvum sp.]|uniref:lysylphosphatidylglycerol synthase transmembrane domain-containing protein n=1 Tax=Sulfuricurvum sp. TaxID=2025608 RepID=UPI003BB7191A